MSISLRRDIASERERLTSGNRKRRHRRPGASSWGRFRNRDFKGLILKNAELGRGIALRGALSLAWRKSRTWSIVINGSFCMEYPMPPTCSRCRGSKALPVVLAPIAVSPLWGAQKVGGADPPKFPGGGLQAYQSVDFVIE